MIVDAGGHTSEQQLASFKTLFEIALRPGGFYFVEGTATSYWAETGGGLGKQG